MLDTALWPILPGGVRPLDASGGYAFDRYYGVGQNQTGNFHDRVDVAQLADWPRGSLLRIIESARPFSLHMFPMVDVSRRS